MFKFKKISVLSFFVLYFGLLVLPSFAQTQYSRFDENDLGISFLYPNTYQKDDKLPTKDVVTVLKGPLGGYPTINVIKQSGDPKIAERSADDLAKEIVDSYRAVGLIEAEVVSSEKVKIAKRDAVYAKLLYPLKDEQVAAGVYLVQTIHNYFVFTFVDAKDTYPTNVIEFEKMMKTLSLRDPAPEVKPKEDGKILVYWFIGFITVAGIFWLASKLFRKK
jgi:hypothetical protein